MKLLTPAVVSSMMMSRWTSYFTGAIRSGEKVVLFPTIARQDEDGLWSVPVHGWLYNEQRREDRKRAFLAVLHKSLKIDNEDRHILRRRMNPFLVDSLRWRKVPIWLGDEKKCYWMPRTPKNGHFQEVVRLSLDKTTAAKGVIKVQVALDDGDDRTFESQIHLVPATGLSVISDIDDTVKISNVTEKGLLLRNTFLKEFQPVPGMAKLYQSLKAKHHCTFHFVSSSPWQLFEELEAFREKEGFPHATFHLKSVRIKDKTLFNLFADPVKTKTATITSILQQYPGRRFLCVGDSGEKDPEVYGALARQYPDQISHILIRSVTTNDESRIAQAFEAVPKEKWSVFTDVTEIHLPVKL